MPFILIFVGLGGAFGAMTRFCLSNFLKKAFVIKFLGPISLVNILGCFLAGCLYPLLTGHSTFLKNFVLIGFLGAFTTFSSFMLEALETSFNSKIFFVFFQISLCNLLSFYSCFLGFQLSNTVQTYFSKFLYS